MSICRDCRAADERSRRILEAMKEDEMRHGEQRTAAGGAPLPALVTLADEADIAGDDAYGVLDLSRIRACLRPGPYVIKTRGYAAPDPSGEMRMEEVAKPLSDMPAINRFLSYCRIRTVPSKTVVIHAGDLPDILYYIISGSVEVMIEDEDGNEMVLAYLNKGQFFGEMGLFYEQPTRSAWVRTRQQCELAEMTYPRFRQIAAESPGLVFELATQLATRLDRTNRKLGDLAFVDVTGRVAHAIMDLCGEPDAMTHPEGMQIKVSRQELSAPRRLLARNGRPRAEGARGAGPAQGERQDHRRLQRAAQGADAPGDRAHQGRDARQDRCGG